MIARALLILTVVAMSGCQMAGRERPGSTVATSAPVSPLVVGIRLLAAKQPALALDAFNRSVTEDGVSVDALSGIGVSYMRLGQRRQARQFMETAVKVDPNSAIARNNFGVLLYDEGEYDAALVQLQRAYALTGGANSSIATNIGFAEFAISQAQDADLVIDESEFDVIQYGKGVYRLEPREPEPSTDAAEL
ncbi:MAG: tetratricopeptide repeat protein [Pseudomonadota bacterium]